MATGVADARALEALMMAAGAGRRFGGRKLFAPYGKADLLGAALGVALRAPVRGVTVVTGDDADAVAEAARAADPRVRIVHAPDHAEGLGASLRMGVASLPADTAGVFVFLADMPRVPVAILGAMATALANGASAVAPTFQGRRGNPVLLGRTLFGDVQKLTGDQGARAIIDGLGAGLALVEAPDDGVLFDVDEPADLTRRSH